MHPNIRVIRAIAMMVGSVVGVGVFGLPFTLAHAGFPLGALFLLILGGFMLCLQLMYVQVILHTPGKDRFVGYIERFIGWKTSRLALGVLSVSLWGAMLAYMIVGGQFLFILLSPLFGGTQTLYSLTFAALGAFFMYRGLGFMARLEVVVIGILLFLFTFISFAALPHVTLAHLTTVDWRSIPLVYGVALFAFGGLGIIPELRDVLGVKQIKHLPHILCIAVGIIVCLYVVFSFAVVGATGPLTTPMAFTGLVPVLGPLFGVIGSILAVITVLSINVLIGVQLQNTLRFDLKVPRVTAWLVVASLPVLLFVLGVREFIDVVGFVGALFSGILGILIVLMYERFRCVSGRTRLWFSKRWSLVLLILFSLGIIAELFHVFGKI